MNRELETKLKTIADHYGLGIQMKKLAEECGEYAASSLKTAVYIDMKNNGHTAEYCYEKIDKSQDESLKEMADVLVLTKQIEYLLVKEAPELKETIERLMTEKVNRQLKRIENEKNYEH